MDWPASSGWRPIANPRLVGETNEQPLVPRFPLHKGVLDRPIRGHRATIRASLAAAVRRAQALATGR